MAGLQHLAHDDVLDLLGRHVGTLERGPDRGATELGGIDRRETAAELADRRAGGGEDHCLGHGWLISGLVGQVRAMLVVQGVAGALLGSAR